MGIVSIIAMQSKGRSYVATSPSQTPEGEFHAPSAGIVSNSGYYDAFPMYEQFSFGRESVLWKKSSGHAPKGPIMLSIKGTGVWSHAQANVGGVLIEGHSISYGITDTDREIFFYQDDDTFHTIKYATRDGGTGNFTYRGTITKSAWADWIAPAPTKVKRSPEGQYRFGFYEGDTAGTRTRGGFYDSSDNGVTFTFASELYDGTVQANGSPIEDWKLNEFDFEWIENTGVNATSTCIAIARAVMPDEGGTMYSYLTSVGGTVWTQDMTEDAGSFVDDNGNPVAGPFPRGLFYRFLPSNSPVCIKLFNGKVVVANGERATTGFKRKYTTNTVAGAKTNVFSGWTAPENLGTYNAEELGSSIDCGYINLRDIKTSADGEPELWGMDYDISTLPRDPLLTEDRCCINQFKIELP